MFPLNRYRVRERLPDFEQRKNQKNPVVPLNDSLTKFLQEMRYGTEDVKKNTRKKKLLVPPGQGINNENFTNTDKESSDDDDEADLDKELNQDDLDSGDNDHGLIEAEIVGQEKN